MGSCRAAQEPSGPSSAEQRSSVSVSAPPSPPAAEASPGLSDGATAAVRSAPSPSGQAANRTACCSDQSPDCGAPCGASSDQRAAEEGAVGQSPAQNNTPELIRAQVGTPGRNTEPLGPPMQGCTVLRTETEQWGPSDGGPTCAPPPRGTGEAAGRACERGPCCAPPDVRRCRTGCQHAARPAAAAPAPRHDAAASSETTAGQVTRPSVTSGIRAALQSTESHASFASPLSSVGPFCRICHEGEGREPLISPCRCAGSVGLVHVSCIEKWLSAANKDSCEICTYRYVTERRPKPLLQWLLNPSNPEDARNLLGDVICFFLLTGLAVIAAYLCLMGASHYMSYKTQWEATGLVVLGLLISAIYCTWLAVTCRYHCRVWRDWRRTHQDVHLLQMKQLSLSTVELNNNAPPAAAAGAAAAGRCRGCHGGSYSCAHCCAACRHQAGQMDVTAAAADDVFEDGAGGVGGSPPPQQATVALTTEAVTPGK